MSEFLMRVLLVPALMVVGCTARAADAQEPEPLPAPAKAPTAIVLPTSPVPLAPYYRRSRYDVWQFYAVDRTGHFRPRVIYAPYGAAYYLETGQPFPWAETHPLEWMPYVIEQ
jgi:hypothetical protein